MIRVSHLLGSRGNKRNVVLLTNSVQAFLIKGASLVVSMLTLPAYMRYFDQQQVLGLWFTALSVLSWILTFDLGIGNGLRNHLVGPIVNGDRLEARRFISSAYVIIGGAAGAFAAAGYLLLPLANWNKVFNVSPTLVGAGLLLSVVRVLFVGVLLQLALRLITSVLYALQRSAVPSFLTLASSVVMLAFVMCSRSNGVAHGLKALSMVQVLAANVPLLLATIAVFAGGLRHSAPALRYFRLSYAIQVMKLGGVFFWLQIMAMLIFNTNEFLISWFVEPGKVVEYQIYNKIFGLVAVLFHLVLIPVWSAVTEACAMKEYVWIRKLYRRLSAMALWAAMAEAVLIPLMQPLVDLWLRDRAIQVDMRLAAACAISATMYIWMGVNNEIVAGIGDLKTPLVLLTLGAVANVPIAFGLSLLTHSWMAIVVANIISMTPYCVVQPLRLRSLLADPTLALGHR